jgi:hypothetical protein
MIALLEVSSILRRHRHRQQSHSLSLRRQEFALRSIRQAWTVIATNIAFIIAIAINVKQHVIIPIAIAINIKYPVIILLSILPIMASVILAIVTNAICTRQRSLLLR